MGGALDGCFSVGGGWLSALVPPVTANAAQTEI